ANHGAQLVVPLLLFTPQPVASIAGVFIVITQAWLICSGNFSWLNVITMTLAIFAFSDSTLALVLPVDTPALSSPPGWYDAFVIAVAALVALLSYWPVRNLVSRGQRMNYSFNRLHFVGSYGAFGHITKERYEVIVEGTDEPALTPATAWKEYEFKGKPGDPKRRPPQIAPYHLRLDWLMWFAALGTPAQHRWFERFVVKLLENDRPTLKLLRHNPFPERPPTHVRARLFHYRFTTRAEKRKTGAYWVRAPVSDYLRPRRNPDQIATGAG
ncbi:MAG: lipase maturation factor family protein, partial [Acidimicrobiia bacterium]